MDSLGMPEGMAEVEGLISKIDECFSLGFSRLGSEQLEGLASVARVFSGTPLGERMKDAVEGLARAEFREEHFVSLAAARQSLQGAQYDALLDQAASKGVGFTRAAVNAPKKAEPIPEIATWMESSRQWLVEVALAGFMQVEQETVLPFVATLERLQQREEAARLAMLLSGVVHELFDCMPIGNMAHVPIRRWSDLWARAMISALDLPAYPESEEVSGALHLTGVDLRRHSHAMSAVFYGVLLPDDGAARHVRLTASGYKVDVLDDDELWQVLDETVFDALIEAYTRAKTLNIKGMRLLGSGDLIWDSSRAKIAAKSDVMSVAAQHINAPDTVLCDAMPLDRHPVQVAVPVYMGECEVKTSDDGALMLSSDGFSVELDAERGFMGGDLTKQFKGVDDCVGLLRYDGRWLFQPLVLSSKGKLTRQGQSATLKIKSSSSIGILKERASMLLRKKS